MGAYHGGGRKKLNLTEAEWKERRKAQRNKRTLQARRHRWEQVVNEIVVQYIEGNSIKSIVENCVDGDYELRIRSRKDD